MENKRLRTEGESEVENSYFLTSLSPNLTNLHWSGIKNMMNTLNQLNNLNVKKGFYT